MTNAEKLIEAHAAYHLLMTGKARVTVRYADRTVQYTQTNKDQLLAYIAELEELEGVTPASKRGQPFEVQWS